MRTITLHALYIAQEFFHSRYNASANSQRQNAPAPTTPPRGRRPAGYNQSQRNKENVHSTNTGPFQGQATRTSTQTPPGSHQRPPYDNNSSRPSLRGSGYTPRDTGCTTTNWKDNRAAHHTTHQTHTPSTARPVNMAPDFSVPGRATEPTQHQVVNNIHWSVLTSVCVVLSYRVPR